MGADFSLFVGAAGIGSNPNPLSLELDLDQLDHHYMIIEHDASLSRADVSTGNNYSFNQTIWDTVFAYYDGMSETSIPVAATEEYARPDGGEARFDIHLWTCPIHLFLRRDGDLYLYHG